MVLQSTGKPERISRLTAVRSHFVRVNCTAKMCHHIGHRFAPPRLSHWPRASASDLASDHSEQVSWIELSSSPKVGFVQNLNLTGAHVSEALFA